MPGGREKEKKDVDFQAALARGMAIAGTAVIPPALVLSGVFGGWRGLAGSFVGLGIASLHSIVVIRVLKWALGKPPQMMPTIVMLSYFGRLIVLAGILYGLTFVKALNPFAMLGSFLALYLAHSVVEVTVAYKSFGVILKKGGGGGSG